MKAFFVDYLNPVVNTVALTPAWTKYSVCSKLILFKMVLHLQSIKVLFHSVPPIQSPIRNIFGLQNKLLYVLVPQGAAKLQVINV